MSCYVIDKKHVGTYLERLKNRLALWVPVREEGTTSYRPYNGQDFPDDSLAWRASVKEFFSPQREEMLACVPQVGDAPAEPVLPNTPIVLFAVRPCDARAVQLNAHLLSSNDNAQYQDVYFATRRERLILVGYGCAQPGVACFCQATGGGPYDHQGLDVIVTDLGEKLLFRLLDKGYGLSSRLLLERDLFSEASDDELRAAEGIAGRAQNRLAAQPLLVPAAGELAALFELPLWDEIAKRCLNCGACTYLCPTCTCFDMIDQSTAGRAIQYRCWDSCMFSLFTLHASGHNPRPEKTHRVRQRFLHKLRYFPDRNGGTLSCTGCGRCVLHCPVNIDIREIAGAISLTR